MKTIFKKAHLPFLKRVLHGGAGRELWTLTRWMQDKNGLQHQLPAELMLVQHGAADGDVWSMCELARTYFFHCGDLFLPLALRFWRKAALENDEGAKSDLQNIGICDRILDYRSPDGDAYHEIEMKCALLAEWHLEGAGLSPWHTLDNEERKARVRSLIKAACPLLHIPDVAVEFVPRLPFNGGMADGLAGWDDKVAFREELLPDLERMIEIIFHELGHIVAFRILRGGEDATALQALYGLSDERVRSWGRDEMGYEVKTSEEDPDTLSYGVYTLFATFFILP